MDIYDEAEWTEMDIEDLRAAIEGGPRSRKRPIYYAAPTASKRWRANAPSWASSQRAYRIVP